VTTLPPQLALFVYSVGYRRLLVTEESDVLLGEAVALAVVRQPVMGVAVASLAVASL